MQEKEERRPSENSNLGFNPLDDSQFADTVQDFLSIYTPKELETHGYLQAYFVELLARWGRWQARGRAPALCFEAACVGGLSYLSKSGRKPSELTARGDALLARLLAGLVIDEVEPMARVQGAAVREKAIGIVADEFLARTGSPRVANPAKKRMKKRRTVIKLGQDHQENLGQISNAESQRSAGLRKMPDSQSSQNYNVQSRKQSIPNDYTRPNVGIRRPSFTDSSPYYDPNYIAQVAPNMEPSLGPGTYYAETSYGRSRRKGSNETDYAQRGNGNRTRQGSNVYPDERFEGPINRGRQGSVPYNDERQGPMFERHGSDYRSTPNRSYSRKGSADTNGFDDRQNDGYYHPRARKLSTADGRSLPQYISPGSSYPENSSTQPLYFYEDTRFSNRTPAAPDELTEFDRRRAGSIDRNAFFQQPHNHQRQQSHSTPNSPRRGPPANSSRQRYATTEEVVRQDDRSRPNRPTNMNFFPSRSEKDDIYQRRPSDDNQRRPSWDEAQGSRTAYRERDIDRSTTPNPVDNQQNDVPPTRGSGKTQRLQESRRVDELGEFLSNVLADCEDFLGKITDLMIDEMKD